MGKYHAGQRVRIKWSLTWPELAGEEGTVLGTYFNDLRGRWGYSVSPDCWGSDLAPEFRVSPVDGGMVGRFGPFEEQLEPLTPTPSAEDILKLKGLPDRDCPLFELLTLESNVQKDSA